MRVTKLPSIIEVRWELPGGRQVWWKAALTETGKRKTRGIVNATAILQYRAAHGFPQSDYHVRFKNASLLTQLAEDGTECTLRWRAGSSELGQVRERRDRMKVIRKRSYQLDQDIAVLRKGISRNTEELKALKQTMVTRESFGSLQEENFRDKREAEVLSFLAHRLAHEVRQTPRIRVRPHSRMTGTAATDKCEKGITETSLRIYADCDQRDFEAIARSVHGISSKLDAEPAFHPSYELTQLPAEGCGQFSIRFGSFADLCSAVGINSISDRIQMMCRYGTKKGEGVLRVLGSYEQSSGDNMSDFKFFVGNSCAKGYERQQGDNEATSRLISILTRDTSTWNKADRRYEGPLQLKSSRIARHMRQACHECDLGKGDFFELKWRRAKELSGRTWSRAIAHPRVVVGRIEMALPCIIVSGSLLCDEYTTKLTDELLAQTVK